MIPTAPDSEFSRIIDIRHIDDKPIVLTATPEECLALARRFGIVSVGPMSATLTLTRDGPVIRANGRLQAAIVQSCAISADDLPVTINEPLTLRFVPAVGDKAPTEDEIELTEEDCDEIEFSGERFELGEAVAQSLALAIDPFATGPNADLVRKAVGLLDENATGPFAALAALKGKT
jgi:hypothetical protein